MAVAFPAFASAVPTVTINSPADASVFTGTDQVTVDFTATPGGSGPIVTCTLNGIDIDFNCASPKLLTSLPDGSYVFDVTIVDGSGSDTASVNFEVNADAPELTFDPSDSSNRTPKYSYMIDQFVSFSFDDPTTQVSCELDGQPAVDCTSGFFEALGLSNGEHTLVVTATDSQNRSSTYVRQIFINSSLEDGAIRIDVTPSTNIAGRHPDVLIDIRNTTDQDPATLTTSMPNGLVGSLRATSDRCPYPDAGLTDYSTYHVDSEVESWCSASERADAKIGTVLTEAKIDDSITRLKGDVILTDHKNPGEVAGMAIVLPAQVSNLDLGNVVLPARLSARQDSPGSSGDIGVNPVGIEATVDEIPASLATENHGSSEFTLSRSRLYLSSTTLTGVPLFTNPSACDLRENEVGFFTQMTTHQGGFVQYSDSYQSEDCDFQPIGADAEISFFSGGSVSGSRQTAGTIGTPVAAPAVGASGIGVRTELTMDDGSTAIKRAVVDLPGSLRQREAGIGTKCSTLQVANIPPTCSDANTRVGWFVADTPLLEQPIIGDIFIVSSGGALPHIYLHYRDPDLGIEVRLRGKAQEIAAPYSHIRVEFNSENDGSLRDLPDVPVNSLEIVIPGSTGQGAMTEVAGLCQPSDAGSFRLQGHTERVAVGLFHHSYAASCGTERTITPDSSTTFTGGGPDGSGGETEDTTPAFDFALTSYDPSPAPAPVFGCSIDSPVGIDGSTFTPPVPDYHFPNSGSPVVPPSGGACINNGDGTGTFTVPSTLRPGIHVLRIRFNYRIGGSIRNETQRVVFEVREPSPTYDPAPIATINSSAHGTTADTTPTFDYGSNQSGAEFECRLDDEPFQPCAGNGDSGSTTYTDGLENGTHTFYVRATDGDDSDGRTGDAGAVDSETFTVDVPFDPTFTYELSGTVGPATQARAHPKLKVTITSESDDDLKSVKFSMPKGFVGSLLGAKERCSVANVNAHTCPTDSKVGTIRASAQADLSDVTVPGEIFLTEPLVDGDPAGLLIRTVSKVGNIQLDDIYLRQRLVVRGNAEGIDAISLDEVPNKIVSTLDNNAEVFFHFRKLVLELTGTPGASQPMITNPSDCSPSAFTGQFTSYGAPFGDSQTTTDEQTFQATGCDSLPFYTAFSAQVEKFQSGGVPTNGDLTKFTATVSASPDDSGVKGAKLQLPVSITADPNGLPIGCSVAQYESTKTCEPSQIIGSATASTPLLPGPLTGNVYLGQPKVGSYVLPGFEETLRVIIQLRGLVNVDLIGKTTLIPFDLGNGKVGSQTVTVFDDVPDAPISSFTTTINKLVRVHPKACAEYLNYRTITGAATAYNDKVSAYNTDISITCPTKPIRGLRASFGGSGKKPNARFTMDTDGSTEFKSVDVKLPRGVKAVKSQFKKRFLIRANRKKAKHCSRVSSTKVNANICNRTALSLDLRFNSGTLLMSKKLSSAKFILNAKFKDGRSQRITVEFSGKRYSKVKIAR